MMEHPDGKEIGSLWRKLMQSKPTEEKRRALDEYVQCENAKALASARSLMRAGLIQIEHVTPEVSSQDEKVEFDTDIFFQRCDWARKKPSIYAALKGFCKNEKGFYIVGKSGCGKSVFAKTYAFQLMKDSGDSTLARPRFCKFMNFGKLMDSLSRDNWAYKNYILDQMLSATHLFIDDIGTEKSSEFNDQILFHVIDSRLFKVVDGVPCKTYFTSNLCINDLPYHERTKRRLKDMAVEVVVAPTDSPTQKGLLGNPTNS